MSEPKSKFPDFKEISSMAGKFFCDVKKSISEIVAEYKKNHPDKPASESAKPKTTSTKVEAEKTAKKPASTSKPKKAKVVDKVETSKDETQAKD